MTSSLLSYFYTLILIFGSRNSISLSVDADFTLQNLDSSLFPGIDDSIKVHNGFADSHAR